VVTCVQDYAIGISMFSIQPENEAQLIHLSDVCSITQLELQNLIFL